MVQRNLSFLFQLDDDDLRQLDCVCDLRGSGWGIMINE